MSPFIGPDSRESQTASKVRNTEWPGQEHPACGSCGSGFPRWFLPIWEVVEPSGLRQLRPPWIPGIPTVVRRFPAECSRLASG